MQGERYSIRIERLTIDVGNATMGMYVSELDRPWLETPFVFQGFEIRNQAEIDLLQQYCQTITVDVYRGSLETSQIRRLLTTYAQSSKAPPRPRRRRRRREPGKLRRRLRNLALRFGLVGRRRQASRLEEEGYPITASVRGEARPAFRAYSRLCHVYEQEARSAGEYTRISAERLGKAVVPVVESILRNPNAMAWTVFSRRLIAQSTSRAVGTAVWCIMFGRQLSFDRGQLHELALGGLLLDIGMVLLPPSLREHQGAMSEEQLAMLAHHIDYGLDILHRSRGFGRQVIDMVAHHHERADGSGYPAGIRGTAIPPFARIAGIADAFDAMTSANAYSPAYAAFDVARLLNEMRGKQFDAEVVDQFLRAIGMFPTASVVELNNGTVGLVIEQNPDNALRPKVMLLRDRDKQPIDRPRIVELRDLPPDATHANALWIARGHEHGAFGIDPMDYFRSETGK